MTRIRNTNLFQKILLIFSAIMVIVFSILYPITVSRTGFLYQDTIFTPTQEDGKTIYSGKIGGKEACFIVDSENAVQYCMDDTVYGTYTAIEDNSAVPDTVETGFQLKGVELRCGEKIVFRGGIVELGDSLCIFHEDGSIGQSEGEYRASIEQASHTEGNPSERPAPSETVILNLMFHPTLTHKGEIGVLFCGILICIVTAFSILYADELFRWGISLRLRNADIGEAEPSQWELFGRYALWIALFISALVVFMIGLQ